METIQKICLAITIIGALVCGFIGLFDFNILTSLFGEESILPRIIYTIVGITGIVNIGILFEHIES